MTTRTTADAVATKESVTRDRSRRTNSPSSIPRNATPTTAANRPSRSPPPAWPSRSTAAAAIPALGVPLAITVAVAAAVDLLGQAGGGDRLERLAGVVGVAFLGMLLGELVRRDRSRVTDSLVATASAVVLVVMLASPLALALSSGGRAVVGATFAAVAAALAVAAVGAAVGGRADNRLGAAATLILAVVAGGGVGAAYGSVSQHGPRWGVAVGLADAPFAAAGWGLPGGSTEHR